MLMLTVALMEPVTVTAPIALLEPETVRTMVVVPPAVNDPPTKLFPTPVSVILIWALSVAVAAPG
jgi:hypothetical protein